MSGASADGGRVVAPTLAPVQPRRTGWRGFMAARDGAVAVEFALITALVLMPFVLMVADSVQRITSERRLQDAMHLVSTTVASDPARLDDQVALRALAADVAVADPEDLELEVSTVCYCPDAQGLSAAPIACQTPCSGRMTFHHLELTQADAGFLPFTMPFGEQETSGPRARALVLAP